MSVTSNGPNQKVAKNAANTSKKKKAKVKVYNKQKGAQSESNVIEKLRERYNSVSRLRRSLFYFQHLYS